MIDLLSAAPDDRRARGEFKRRGFADPAAALRNLHSLAPTPRDGELLAPAVERLVAELANAPDPDMALNNLERLAGQGDRTAFLTLLVSHPGAIPLLARLGGTSQFLADTLRRHPTLLPWLLEPRTMKQWLADELEEDLTGSLAPFASLEGRSNALRRFKYRQLLRVGCRDILGDADLTVTTEELSRLADVCLVAAWRWAHESLEARYGIPVDSDGGAPTALAVIGMGKLGGDELNYSSDIDLIFVYGEDGHTTGGEAGSVANGEFFKEAVRAIVGALESVTEEGYAFRVDLRLRPEGRMGALVLSLAGYRAYLVERAAPWERQALIKARFCAGDPDVARRFFDLIRPFVFRSGLDPGIVGEIRGMKRAIDQSLRGKDAERRNVKLGIGGIREVEFLVQALQLLYGGDDPWLREKNSLRAIFRFTERGYLSPALGRFLGDALVHLRTVEHRLQILHEFQTHMLPEDPVALGLLARRMGIARPPRAAGRAFLAMHRRITRGVHGAFRDFFAAPPAAARPAARIPTYTALKATGFSDPDRARQNLRLLLEGRPLIPYPDAARQALTAMFPVLLDALWQSPDPDEALNQFERLIAAAGPRVAYLELLAARPELLANVVKLCARGVVSQLLVTQPELLSALTSAANTVARRAKRDCRAALAPVFAPRLTRAERKDRLRQIKQTEELGITWRMLLGVTDADRFSLEMTGLADAAVACAWLMALEETMAEAGIPRDDSGRMIPAAIVGIGKFGGRELTTGSDLDLFVVYERPGLTDGPSPVEAHVFYDRAVERLSELLGDITAAGIVFPVDLRLRPGSKGSGFATSLDAAEHYYREWADPWERQTLTRARLVGGDPRLGRMTRKRLGALVYGPGAPPPDLKEMRELRERMEKELGKENPGRLHVKFGRGGVVDVEFITQALQMLHGASVPAVRRANTILTLRAIRTAGLLAAEECDALIEHYRFLRRVSAGLRLFGARPPDTLEPAGPIPGRLAKSLDYPSRKEFLADYRRRTAWVRALYDRIVPR